MLAQGAIGGLINTSDSSKRIGFGLFRVYPGMYENSFSPDLRVRGLEFIIIPGDGTEVRVTLDLPFSRMFKYAEGIKKEDLRPGESYKLRMYHGHVGTTWWCWGDLEGDLKDRKLCAWQKGNKYNDVAKPSDEDVEKEGWVIGEDPAQLEFEDRTEGGYAVFQIVE